MPKLQTIHKAAETYYQVSGKAEHLGFVLVAFVDVFQMHQAIWLVSVYLLLTGVPSLVKDCKGR